MKLSTFVLQIKCKNSPKENTDVKYNKSGTYTQYFIFNPLFLPKCYHPVVHWEM